MHHPWRQNVTTSRVGLKNGHICKNLTQNGEAQRYSWGMQKKITTPTGRWVQHCLALNTLVPSYHDMLHVISTRCVARDLHTIVPGPLGRTCWRWFAAQWGDCKKSWIAPLNAFIIITLENRAKAQWNCLQPPSSGMIDTGKNRYVWLQTVNFLSGVRTGRSFSWWLFCFLSLSPISEPYE